MIDFPNNPSNGNTYDYNGIRYTWKDTGSGHGFWQITDPGLYGVATASEINTGTDAVKYVTPLELDGSGYTDSVATSIDLGLVKVGYTEDAAGKKYPVELSSDKMYVHVPWVNTNTDTDTDTWRGIHDTPVNGATTTSISSNWAYDNVKKAVPSNALFTDTNTWPPTGTTSTRGSLLHPTINTGITGYWKCNETGIIIQYGYLDTLSTTPTITFPIAFPLHCGSVQVTVQPDDGEGNSGGWMDYIPLVRTTSKNDFGLRVVNINRNVFWMAMGY